MADPADPAILDTLIEGAIDRLNEQSALVTLVPLFATTLAQHLEDRGFVEQGECTVLARRTTKTVEQPQLAPKSIQSFPT